MLTCDRSRFEYVSISVPPILAAESSVILIWVLGSFPDDHGNGTGEL